MKYAARSTTHRHKAGSFDRIARALHHPTLKLTVITPMIVRRIFAALPLLICLNAFAGDAEDIQQLQKNANYLKRWRGLISF